MLPATATLLIIDLQRAIDHPDWGIRNHPDAEAKGAGLLAAWRSAGRPIVHVRHDSIEPLSHYRPGQSGHDFKPEFVPLPGERVQGKHTPSAFANTPLDAELKATGCDTLIVFGVITNNSVEATVRHAACLGYRVYLVEDACFTFARADYSGVWRTAGEVHAMSLANLQGEYCEVVTAAWVAQRAD